MASVGRDAEDGETNQTVFHPEKLDPRIQDELEKLNLASDEINRLELELDEARASFRQVLTESTHRLKGLAKKLGSCIEKARPYYEARMKAKEAQVETQHAALRYERACSQLAAAKEMVFLAEQGFFNKGQPFDPAWQEMLNHATMKVNDAEKERLEGEIEHRNTALVFNEAEQTVKALQKDLKRNIAKSRPYFEIKAAVNQQMQEQKSRVGQLEKAVITAKKDYSSALCNLEAISDHIHQQRREAQLRLEMGTRSAGVGAEAPEPPPAVETPSEDSVSPPLEGIGEGCNECFPDKMSGDDDRHLVNWGPTTQHPLRKDSSILQEESLPTSKQLPNTHKPAVSIQGSQAETCSKQTNVTMPPPKQPPIPRFLIAPALDIPTVHIETANSDGSSISPPYTSPDPESETESERSRTIRTNAEVMESLQRAKGATPRPFLRPNRGSRDSLLDETADTDSLTGSMASVSMLDDEQVESLMVETGEYLTFLTRLDEQEKAQWKRMSLPSRLAYLESYMKSRPDWLVVNQGEGSLDENDMFYAGDACSRGHCCSVEEGDKDKLRQDGHSVCSLSDGDSTEQQAINTYSSVEECVTDSPMNQQCDETEQNADNQFQDHEPRGLRRKVVKNHPLASVPTIACTSDEKSNTVRQITHITHL